MPRNPSFFSPHASRFTHHVPNLDRPGMFTDNVKMRSAVPFSSLMVWGVFFFLLPFGSGCSSKTPQYPEDHARFERIVEAIEGLRGAYQEKDSEALRELMLPLEGLERLQLDMKKDFNTYADIELKFSIERMAIKGGRATVNIRWEGEWKRQARNTGITRQGHGVLIWSGRQVILLADVDGDLPFGMATRESLS